MIKTRLQALVEEAVFRNHLSGMDRVGRAVIEPCRNQRYGDFSTAAALKLAAVNNLKAPELARKLADSMAQDDLRVDCRDGFLNFQLGCSWLAMALQNIMASEDSDRGSYSLERTPVGGGSTELSGLQILHARAAAALRQAVLPAVSCEAWLPPWLSEADLKLGLAELAPAEIQVFLETRVESLAGLKKLVICLDEAAGLRDAAVTSRVVKDINRCQLELCRRAAQVPDLWTVRITPGEYLEAHLGLIWAVKKIAGNLLGIMDQVAPEWL